MIGYGGVIGGGETGRAWSAWAVVAVIVVKGEVDMLHAFSGTLWLMALDLRASFCSSWTTGFWFCWSRYASL